MLQGETARRVIQLRWLLLERIEIDDGQLRVFATFQADDTCINLAHMVARLEGRSILDSHAGRTPGLFGLL
jgi:hypothetical protein